MKRKEIFVLNWLFASLYFPTSIFLWFLKPTGTFIGVLIVGLVFHIILTILLVLMLFTETQKQTTKTEIITPKERRAYKKKNKQEVENNEEEKIGIGIEPKPEMRTDVNLDQLNDDTDDELD